MRDDIDPLDWRMLERIARGVKARWSSVVHDIDELMWPGYEAMKRVRSRLREGASTRGTYVRTRVWGAMTDYVRELIEEPVVRLDMLPGSLEAKGGGVPELLSDKVEAEAMLDLLTPRQRRVLVWRLWEGWTLGEIAEVEGVSRERARQITEEAIKEIRVRLDLEGVDDE